MEDDVQTAKIIDIDTGLERHNQKKITVLEKNKFLSFGRRWESGKPWPSIAFNFCTNWNEINSLAQIRFKKWKNCCSGQLWMSFLDRSNESEFSSKQIKSLLLRTQALITLLNSVGFSLYSKKQKYRFIVSGLIIELILHIRSSSSSNSVLNERKVIS